MKVAVSWDHGGNTVVEAKSKCSERNRRYFLPSGTSVGMARGQVESSFESSARCVLPQLII